MRIAYVASTPLPARSANSLQVMKMCQAFAAAGHDVTLVALQPPQRSTDAEIFGFYGVAQRFTLQLVRLPFVRGMSILFAVPAVAKARALGADLLYSRSLWCATLGVLRGLDTIYEIHEYSAFSRPVHRAAFRFLLRHPRLRRLVTISTVLRNDVIADHPDAASRVIVAHDAADPVEMHSASIPTRDAKALTVGYVGQLYPGKGFEMIRPLAERCPNATFHVVGGDDRTVNALRSDPTMPSNIVLHGFLPHRGAERIRLQCSVLIAPFQSRISVTNDGRSDIARWTSPLKLFEYMAAAKPILCSDLPVLREVLVDGKTALMLPPDDPDAWASALQRVAADRGLADRLGAAAREEFMSKYTWTKRAEAILWRL